VKKTVARPIPLLDLNAQYETIREEVEEAVRRVFETQRFVFGPEVESLEAEFASFCGSSFGVGVSSGTDALLVALMAEGIGPGDEVITSPFTFFATAGCVHRLGARPVFVDIDPLTYNIVPASIEAAVTDRTRAIVPVHLYGQPAEMGPIMDLADAHELLVIEDACQAVGAEYRGLRAGSLGHYGCFSFFPSKNLGGAGDAGFVTTSDSERAERLRHLRNHGETSRYHHKLIGGNFRLDALQAAVLRVKLRHLDGWNIARSDNADAYRDMFVEAGLDSVVVLPTPQEHCRHVFHQFVIRIPERDQVLKQLQGRGIGCQIYYPVPLHLQECFEFLGFRKGDFPVSEQAAQEVLALPIYPELTREQIGRIVEEVAIAFAS
jgi:dTDP-4-amino-4,6-dideoxygalactose transaminase